VIQADPLGYKVQVALLTLFQVGIRGVGVNNYQFLYQ
jgi:hypothetical protein